MEIKEILEKVLEFYDDHDWIQGQSFQVEDSRIKGACLEGACYHAASTANLNALHITAFLRDVAAELFPERMAREFCGGAVFQFNDHPLTTREDALLVLKHAIQKAEDGPHDRAEPAG